MKTLFFLLVAGLTNFVNPFVGTDGHGHTFPGAAYPFGMVQLSPDTRLEGWDGCSGYHWTDDVIYGFTHTHLSGTGCSDYGDILLMPVTGRKTAKTDRDGYSSKFSHGNESARPGYYKVRLDRWKTDVELATGKRCGIHRYTFQRGATPQVMMDMDHRDILIGSEIDVEVIGNETVVSGYRRSRGWNSDQKVWYYIVYSAPAQKKMTADSTKLLLEFPKTKKNVLLAKIGISSVSEANAKANLESDLSAGSFDFDAVAKSADAAWEEYLEKIEVPTADTKAARTFYTALYHTAIHPNLYSDVNGEYRGHDGEVHVAEGYDQYTVFSLWDTFRALHPLFTIIERERTNDFVKSFISIYKQAGKLPVWELYGFETNCMIGYHAVPVIADAYIKGIRGFNADEALFGMLESSNRNDSGIDLFNRYGYVPCDLDGQSVSKTLEYAYDDWCIARYAEAMAAVRVDKIVRESPKPLNFDDIYARNAYLRIRDSYDKKAEGYKNVMDPASHFMRPRRSDGTWKSPFNPLAITGDYTEGNAWQYSFFVPQDVDGFIEAYGGDEAFAERLDSLFTIKEDFIGEQSDVTGLIGQYAHGNEPSHHIAYLYSFCGRPWKTAEYVNEICRTLYSDTPDGLCGNEDCGQMSAWYVFSALGFYPVTPGSDKYVIGTPLFDNAAIHLENGNIFRVNAKRDNAAGIYVKSATVSGSEITFLSHGQIMDGLTLDFDLTDSQL